MDGYFYSTPSRQVLYAFGRLTGKASQRMLPWMRASGTDTSPYSLEKFWKEMERAFGDADRKQRALVRLHRSKQGRKELREFLGEFDQGLAEAGALTWSDEQKKAMLEQAVNLEILVPLIGQPILGGEDTYENYCDTRLRVEHQQKRLRTNTRSMIRAPPVTTPETIDTDAMDWEPTSTRIAASQAENAALRAAQGPLQRARWVNESEMQARRARRACFRCGQLGHMVDGCRLLPPKRPTSNQYCSPGHSWG
ncbi:hypothetical protein N7535_005464 [Penicillium sp. DV-2018c]|nr:hypothetical protein N7535_005464 [Penicillium sp. DV-2018c]